jgi:hypothetical protein
MPTLGNALDFAKYEARNIRGHQLGAAPSSPVTGQLYYNTADNTLYWWDGSAWVSARGGVSAVPPATTGALGTIQLAGDLAGTATSPQIAAGVITDADVNAANKDGTPGVASMRTLGSGAQQAAAGNDARLTNARAPTAHASTHAQGGSDVLPIDTVAATPSMRTLGSGSNQAVQGDTKFNMLGPANGSINAGGQLINNVANPSAAQDAVNKQYVDGVIQGITWKQPVKLVATINIAGGGVPGDVQTIDGVATGANDRVLLTAQSNPQNNGIWQTAIGVSWNRVTDADTSAELVNAAVFVSGGTTNADTAWVCTTDGPITVGTTPLTWVQFSGAAQVISGAGLTKTGNTLDVGAGAGITVNADSIQVANNGITNAMIADGAIVLSTPDVSGTLPVANGGTGQTAIKAARETGLSAAGYYTSAVHGAGTTITIPQATHSLRASSGLIVQCQVDATGAVVLPDISVAANGDVTVTFGVSQTANTIRTTIVG